MYMAFGTTLKIRKKFNFDQDQLKLSMQIMNMYMYQKILPKNLQDILSKF